MFQEHAWRPPGWRMEEININVTMYPGWWHAKLPPTKDLVIGIWRSNFLCLKVFVITLILVHISQSVVYKSRIGKGEDQIWKIGYQACDRSWALSTEVLLLLEDPEPACNAIDTSLTAINSAAEQCRGAGLSRRIYWICCKRMDILQIPCVCV